VVREQPIRDMKTKNLSNRHEKIVVKRYEKKMKGQETDQWENKLLVKRRGEETKRRGDPRNCRPSPGGARLIVP
jgi:hypothetical protein